VNTNTIQFTIPVVCDRLIALKCGCAFYDKMLFLVRWGRVRKTMTIAVIAIVIDSSGERPRAVRM